MPVDDIRQFVEELEKAGELKRVKTEVDSDLEIAEILRRASYTNGPAIFLAYLAYHDDISFHIKDKFFDLRKCTDRCEI